MKIIKFGFRFVDDETWKTCDAIEHEGKLWIVTRWLENKELGIAKPERIIQMDGLPYTKSPVPSVDWVLQIPIPESVFHLDTGQLTPAPFFSIALPDITVELPPDQSTVH